jgi:hypothetical protein
MSFDILEKLTAQKDAEQTTSKAGNPMCVINAFKAGRTKEDKVWVKVYVSGENNIPAAKDIRSGEGFLVAGLLNASAYVPKDGGDPRVSFSIFANKIVTKASVASERGKPRPAHQSIYAPRNSDNATQQPISLSDELNDVIPF